jgi:hypothetical protein|tara:strand:- start:7280 stop:7549 length:270 start_codon:yes stop_codon:yes gene_type:complete
MRNKEKVMLKLMEVSEGFYKAINIVSDHTAFIDRDMLGDYRGTVETLTSEGYVGVESDAYETIEEAARWIECQGIVMTTNFDGTPRIVA